MNKFKNLSKSLVMACFLFLSVILLNPITTYAEEQEDNNNQKVNDQVLAQQLMEEEINTNVVSGWQKNDKSFIFTTIYDDFGDYRGYKIVQINKGDTNPQEVIDYRNDIKNVCSIGELQETTLEYDGEEHQSINIVCMQKVGNEGSFTLDGDKVTINKGYGKTDGYVVGLKVLNSSFDEVKGGNIVNDILYVDDNNGGSAITIPKEVVEEEQSQEMTNTSTNNLDKEKIILIGLVVGIVIIVILIICLIKKKKNNKVQNDGIANQTNVSSNQTTPQAVGVKIPQAQNINQDNAKEEQQVQIQAQNQDDMNFNSQQKLGAKTTPQETNVGEDVKVENSGDKVSQENIDFLLSTAQALQQDNQINGGH